MYPLLLEAPIKDYIWGGTRLKTEFGFETDKKIAAEAWVLSCNKNGVNIIKNGEYAQKPLNDILFGDWKNKALGKKAERFSDFPLLIKLIDARERLSIQVHPDDTYAIKNSGNFGKTEMWYVIDAEEGAEIIYGLKHRVSKKEFELRIKNESLFEICNCVPVKKGDVFFIPAGTLHAIGKGILIAEIQQNSDTTYRVYDYNRKDHNGKPRELHIKQALDVTNRQFPSEPYGDIGKTENFSFGKIRKLADCDYFNVELIELCGKIDFYQEDSFISLLLIDGEAEIYYNENKIHIKKGNSLFVPAKLRFYLFGKATFIKTNL